MSSDDVTQPIALDAVAMAGARVATQIDRALADLRDVETLAGPSRPLAMTRTKLDEAALWLDRLIGGGS